MLHYLHPSAGSQKMQDLLSVESVLGLSAGSRKMQDRRAVVQRPLALPARIPQAPMNQRLLHSATVHLKALVHVRHHPATEAPPLRPLQLQSAALLAHALAAALVVAVEAAIPPPLTLLQLQSAARLARALAAALVVLVAAAKPMWKLAIMLQKTLTMRACYARSWLFSEVARLCRDPQDFALRV
jgi:hypothetical protein